MKMLKMCLNWKVIAGLAVVGVGFYAIAPDLALASLPILLIAICPLSMMFMMKGMHGNQGEGDQKQASEESGADLTREEEMDRLQARRAALAQQIDALEAEEEHRPARDVDRT